MKKLARLASGLLSVVVVAAFIGYAKADLPATSGNAIRFVFDIASGRNNRFFFNTVTNQFVFGSSQTVTGSVLASSGTVVILSTTSTATQAVLDVRNNTGTSLFKVQQNGSVQISSSVVMTKDITTTGNITAGTFIGSGAGITGLAGANATNTWTQPQYYATSLNVSSGVVSVANIGNGSVAGSGSLNVAANSTETVSGLLSVSGVLSLTGAGSVHITTYSYANLTPSTIIAPTPFSGCNVANSTVSITSHGEDIEVYLLSKSSSGVASTVAIKFWVMRDGTTVLGDDATQSIGTFGYEAASNNGVVVSHGEVYRDASPSVGQHTYCLGWGAGNNPVYLNEFSVFGVRTMP